MYLAAVKAKADDGDEDEEPAGNELRKLEFVKNNYGPAGNAVVLRWRDGVFAPEPTAGSLEDIVAAQKADEVFMSLLHRFSVEGRAVSHKPSVSYAPANFAKEKEAKEAGIRRPALVAAMARLFVARRIRATMIGPQSRQRTQLEAT
jgi:RecA-family ATPase